MVIKVYKVTFFTWPPQLSSFLPLLLSLLKFRRAKVINSENIFCIDKHGTIIFLFNGERERESNREGEKRIRLTATVPNLSYLPLESLVPFFSRPRKQ
jgi:hypothetical protein